MATIELTIDDQINPDISIQIDSVDLIVNNAPSHADDYFISATKYPNINDAVIAAVDTGKILLVPSGTYTPNGPLDLTGGVRLQMKGAGHQRTTIDQSQLTAPWIETDQKLRELLIEGFTFDCPNAEAFRRSYGTINNTGGQWTCIIRDNIFNNRKTALSIQTPDTPHGLIERNKFHATGNEGRGLVLRGNPTNFIVRNNVFISQLYGIIDYFDGGGYGEFNLNEFFCFQDRPTVPVMHVWFIPGDNNDGRGTVVIRHKHGGEYDVDGDTPYLFAEANSLDDLTIAVPSRVKSTKKFTLLDIEKTTIATAGTTPAIVSYTANLDRCEFDLKRFNTNRPLIGSGLDVNGLPVLSTNEIADLQKSLASVAQDTGGNTTPPDSFPSGGVVGELIGIIQETPRTVAWVNYIDGGTFN
ncbi:MAG: right-handed parallel beta-helix repeat-containing protein [Microcoleus sp.]